MRQRPHDCTGKGTAAALKGDSRSTVPNRPSATGKRFFHTLDPFKLNGHAY